MSEPEPLRVNSKAARKLARDYWHAPRSCRVFYFHRDADSRVSMFNPAGKLLGIVSSGIWERIKAR